MNSVEKIEQVYKYYQDDVTGTTVAKISNHNMSILCYNDMLGFNSILGFETYTPDQLQAKARCNKQEDCFESELGKKIAAKKLTTKITINELKKFDEAIIENQKEYSKLIAARDKLIKRLMFCNKRMKSLLNEVVQVEDIN